MRGDIRLSKSFPLRNFMELEGEKYSDAGESLYLMRNHDGIEDTHYIVIQQDFCRNVHAPQAHVKSILQSVGENVDGMQWHDSYYDYWELAVDSDSAAFTMFILVVSELLR